MSIVEVHMHLQILIDFAFVSQYVSRVLAFAKNHSFLPDIKMKDYSIMMKLNTLKKNKALKIIIQLIMKEELDAPIEEYDDGWEVLSDGIFPRGCDVLKSDVGKTDHKAFAILEWWSLNRNRDKQELGVPVVNVFTRGES